MLRYKAGYKYVDGGVHAQVLDFPAAITCAGDLAEARRLLGIALVDVAEAAVESGLPLPVPAPDVFDAEMDIEEPIYLHLRARTRVCERFRPGPCREATGSHPALTGTRLSPPARPVSACRIQSR